jgi:hypothetical protein
LKFITIIQGIKILPLMKLIVRNGITPLPVYLLRFFVLLQGALVSSVFTVVERLKFGRKLKHLALTAPPLFIIGHWRTGSTLLHHLLSLDPGMTAPNLLQTVIPDHFLTSSKYYIPILKKMTPAKRPMDNVLLGPFEPQEEEFALIRMGSRSPLEGVLFPSGRKYFLEGYPHYVPAGRQGKKWDANLLCFYRKLTFLTGKRIVSKNPCHTMRMAHLADMFPGAGFIHIVRDPMAVIPSTIRMWDIVAKENKLKSGGTIPGVKAVAEVLDQFLEQVDKEKHCLEPGRFTEVRFENLESDPEGTVKEIYGDLGLEFSAEFEKALGNYLSGIKDYTKNQYELSREEGDIIRKVLKKRLPYPDYVTSL